jgi:NADPH-dependent 2,4-dienoyl-CoA reductase/sulfur reductase-like enzyme
VVSPEEVPLQKQLGAEIGAMIQTVHEEKGVRFHLGRQVRQFDGRRLALDDGSSIEADFVVLGTGIKPRTELARAAGLAVAPVEDGGGVIVNERLESSVPGIFAIGDIAQYPDPHTGRRIRVEHWVHAQRHGQHVARVIMGQANGFADPPFFWSAHFDTGLRYLGHVDTLGASTTEGSLEARSFSRCQHGTGSEKAYITCNRDLDSLRAEADWDQAI